MRETTKVTWSPWGKALAEAIVGEIGASQRMRSLTPSQHSRCKDRPPQTLPPSPQHKPEPSSQAPEVNGPATWMKLQWLPAHLCPHMSRRER